MARIVLVLGATGMLARPVVRQLCADGFAVRAGVRDVAKARRLLPPSCEFVDVEVRRADTVVRAMQGCDVVYLNLSSPHSSRGFDPDLEAAQIVAKEAAKAGVKRVMRISTMGLPDGASSWWLAERKQLGDDQLRECGVPHTIFQPTWFMESLPLFLMGRRIMMPPTPPEMLYWIAGEDYARQVSNAVKNEAAANRTFIIQGKYPASMRHAIYRFAASFDPTLKALPVPRSMLALSGMMSAKARYLRDLLDFTYRYATGFHAEETFALLGEPTMTIEDYARNIRASGDVPRK